MEFSFTLTEQECQVLLTALSKEPFIQVFELVNKIQKQASEQAIKTEK